MLVALVAGIAIVVAVGAGAALVLRRGSSGGGASSPDAAVAQLVSAVQRNDLLAVADMVPPDEREALPMLVKGLSGEVEKSGITGGVLPKLRASVDAAPAAELATDVDAVQVTGQVGIDLGAIRGEVGRLLGARRTEHPDHEFVLPGTPGGAAPGSREDAPPLRLIAIRQHGRWYVDPLLSAGDYLALRLGLPGGDFSQVDFHSGSGGTSPTDAMSRFLDALASEDPVAAADVAAPADERFLRVFAGALSSYVGRFQRTMAVSQVQLSDDGGGKVGVHGLTVTTGDPYRGSTTLSLHSTCVHWTQASGETSPDVCVPTENALRARLGLDLPELDVVEDGGSYRVDVLGSMTSLLAGMASQLDDDTLNGIVDRFEPFPPPASSIPAISVGTTLDGAYHGHLYRVFALHVTPRQRITLTPSQDATVQVSSSPTQSDSWCRALPGQPCSLTALPGVRELYVFVAWPWLTKSPECRAAFYGLDSLGTGCWWVPEGARYHVTIAAG
jgi:hypothetical protein